MFGRVGANEAAVIIDYGQKVEPTGQIESQSECFGKAGISQFGATFLMPASSFEKTKLEEMVGEERTQTIKPGDMVPTKTGCTRVCLYALVLCCC